MKTDTAIEASNSQTIIKNILKFVFELFIIFLGVYIAFLFSNYSDNQKAEIEKNKIMASLKSELQNFKIQFPGYASYQLNRISEMKLKKDSNKIADFYTYRFVQPQYNYTVIEYAINTRTTGIIEFNLYKKLANIFKNLKMLEFSENKMTELALLYQPLSNVDRVDKTMALANEKNKFIFDRFIKFAEDRSSVLNKIADISNTTLPIINSYFSIDELKKIDRDILIESILSYNLLPSDNEIYEMIKESDIKMNNLEIKEFIKQIKKIKML